MTVLNSDIVNYKSFSEYRKYLRQNINSIFTQSIEHNVNISNNMKNAADIFTTIIKYSS